MPKPPNPLILQITRNFFNATALELFQFAYRSEVGKVRIIPEALRVLETYPKDRNKLDAWKTENLFSYEVRMPGMAQDQLQQQMQDDVNAYFRMKWNVEAVQEQRMMKCLVLKQLGSGRMHPPSDKPRSYKRTDSARTFVNYPFNTITRIIGEELEDLTRSVAFINEASVSDPKLVMDIVLPDNLKDLESLRAALKPYSLNIAEETRSIGVLVIRDKVSSR